MIDVADPLPLSHCTPPRASYREPKAFKLGRTVEDRTGIGNSPEKAPTCADDTG